MSVSLNWKSVKLSSGGVEHFCSASVTPGVFENFAAGAAALWQRYLEEKQLRKVDGQKELLLRFHLSDVTNQMPLLSEITGGVEASVINQPPADGSRITLEAWFSSLPGLKMIYSPDEREGSSFEQTARLFEKLDDSIRQNSGSGVASDVLRTWLYCRDVDNNYRGLVLARNEFFDRCGLTERYLASTGIDGSGAIPSQLVVLDTLIAPGVKPSQITHLRALDHLSPTAEYGVRFERGTRVSFEDCELYLISGTASIDCRGKVMFVNDFRQQCRRTLENISALLAEGGAEIADITGAVVYLRDPADLNIAREEFSILPVEPLYLRAPVCRPEWLVECECIALR